MTMNTQQFLAAFSTTANTNKISDRKRPPQRTRPVFGSPPRTPRTAKRSIGIGASTSTTITLASDQSSFFFLVSSTSTDGSFIDAPTLTSTSSMAATPVTSAVSATSSNFEPISFEPVLDVPALMTFLFIMTIFAALNFRTSQVEKIVQERNYWLERVRELKAKELSSGSSGVGGEDGNSNSGSNNIIASSSSPLQIALENYEAAVLKEEKLRNLIPGGVVRIVPPSVSTEEDQKAAAMAKQFLGKDYNIGSMSSTSSNNSDDNNNNNASSNLPSTAVVVLPLMAMVLTSLLVFLNISDPMSSSDGFTMFVM